MCNKKKHNNNKFSHFHRLFEFCFFRSCYYNNCYILKNIYINYDYYYCMLHSHSFLSVIFLASARSIFVSFKRELCLQKFMYKI
jgi:hypothetical protein